ncbi:MAG: S-methyl-5-thioribose-1-phosphate isomerase [Gemmatimonadetes bacterium]|nr:S-methyl-5-thioribose-1-phosphate isomerase [Gemmatimonadota bacterium]
MSMRSDAISWSPKGSVRLLDQTLLPATVRHVEIDSIDGMVEAIQALTVRGAPLIGIAAAMGLAAAAGRRATTGDDGRRRPTAGEKRRRTAGVGDEGRLKGPEAGVTPEWIDDAIRRLASARPTAVNLRWALDRMRRAAEPCFRRGERGAVVAAELRAEAERIWDEDAAMCEAIGQFGQALVPAGATILTICNTGMLATGGIGTALGITRTAHEMGKGIDVIACETRPLGQGARLTMWELARLGIPGRLIVDAAAASLMASGEVDLVVTGADRIAANGDVANKVGTYALAVLARAHDLPFYVAAPVSTVDPATASGDGIPIEERAAREITTVPGVAAYNPAFDVTPAELVSAIITDRGVLRPPFAESLRRVVSDAAPQPA